MPEEYGSVTPSAAAVATAASTAFPPWRSTSVPAAEASASTLATAPPYPMASGLLAGVGCGAGARDAGAAAVTAPTVAVTASAATVRTTRVRTLERVRGLSVVF